ncbi:MAG: hypothetical protein P4L83_07170 [Nevskia sp.]|nr:hypothetical protein [Nevskia sp.]
MEIFPYIFSVLLTALVMRWSRLAAGRKPGTPLTGLFKYRDKPGKIRQPTAKPAPWR